MIKEKTAWTENDSARARQIWKKYQQLHDLSDRTGQTVGIDPKSGRIWFGESIQDVVLQRDSEGYSTPLFFERVGAQAYFSKYMIGCGEEKSIWEIKNDSASYCN